MQRKAFSVKKNLASSPRSGSLEIERHQTRLSSRFNYVTLVVFVGLHSVLSCENLERESFSVTGVIPRDSEVGLMYLARRYIYWRTQSL